MTEETLFKSDMRLMFAQVREDAAVDQYLLAQTGNRAGRVLVIASGGCTAFSLISAGAHEVEAIDVNQSQLALVDKKIKLLKSGGFEAFKTACLAAHGLNNCGWVDSRMLQLTALFYAFVHSRTETQKFLLMEDTQMQKVYFEKTWSNWRWRLMTNIAFSRLFLRLTHGPAASYLVSEDFAGAMTGRLQKALTAFPNATNPYLWQAFFGQYNQRDDALPPYLQNSRQAALSQNIDRLHLHSATIADFLKTQADASFDYINLSNVLELIQKGTSDLYYDLLRCLRPNGLICVRAIFPRTSLTFVESVTEDGRRLVYDESLSRKAAAMDRSLFCNFYEIYRAASTGV